MSTSTADFENQQSRYYTQSLRPLPVSSGVARGVPGPALTSATVVADPLVPATARRKPDTDVSQYLSDFGASSQASQFDAACRALPYPSVGMRGDGNSQTGCGWWVSDSEKAGGAGAYGTRQGPMNPFMSSQIGPGRWVWDPREAWKLEGMKAARTVKACSDLPYVKFPGIGWCPSTNAAVLTDGNGNPAFPREAGGDCPGGGILMAGDACPPVSLQNQTLSSIGSVCVPDPTTGALSPACLQTLTSAWGCSADGGLAQALSGPGYASSSSLASFQSANRVLEQRGFSLNPGILRDGKLTTDDMWSSLKGLKTLTTDADAKSKGAALALCYGTPFDPCALSDADTGPYDSQCITQTALGMGYSANGKLMPGNKGMDFWNSFKTWGDVVTTLAGWKQQADTGGGSKQKQQQAIANVYGVAVKFPGLACNTTGVMMYRYLLPASGGDLNSLFPPRGASTHFLGRYLLKNGFTGLAQQNLQGSPNYAETHRFLTNFVPAQGGTCQFLVSGSGPGSRLLVDDTVVLSSSSAAPATSEILKMFTGQPYKLTVDRGTSIAVSFNSAPWSPIQASQLYLLKDRRLPMIDFSFSRMPEGTQGPRGIQDADAVFQSFQLSPNARIGSLSGRNCMIVSGYNSNANNRNGYIQGVRFRAIKSFTMMVNISNVSFPGGAATPSLVAFYNLPTSNPTGVPKLSGSSQPFTYRQRTDDFMISSDMSFVYPYGLQHGTSRPFDIALSKTKFDAIQANQWCHFAFVWDMDGEGATVYLNGSKSKGVHFSVSPYDVDLIMENFVIGCDEHPDGQTWTGGIAWFRAFDYFLSIEDIERDMNDAWDSL